jgi:hypothetical protein
MTPLTPTTRIQGVTVEADVAAAVAVYMVETTTTAAAEETANPLLHRHLSQLARSLP